MAIQEDPDPLATLPYLFLDRAQHVVEFVRRQTNGGSSTNGPVLSTGAIIGIAVAGGAVLFGVLIFVVMRCARARFRRRRRKTFRKLDLADDDDDIHPAAAPEV